MREVGNLHVTTKLMAAFGFMVAMTMLVSFEGVHSAAMLNENIKSLFHQDLSGISSIKEAGIFEMKCTRVLRDLVLANGNKELIEDQKLVLAELDASVDEWLAVAQQAFSDNQSQLRLKEIDEQIPQFRRLSSKVSMLALSGDQKGALAALKETNQLSNRINLTIAEICRSREEVAKDSEARCERTYHDSRVTMVGCSLFSLLFGLTLCMLTVRMIAQPLKKVMLALQMASNGDLTARVSIQHRDEIGIMGLALNEALESTRAVLQKVRETAWNLGTVASELAATANGMAKGAEAQEAGFDKTSASLEEITVTARNNAAQARQASGVATHFAEVVQNGTSVVAAATLAMLEINESSERISQIAEAVDEVAFQTNLLSVNAAIEAARAGEQGKSFGVVAEEIRSLSKRSAESARGIRKIIQHSLLTVQKGSASISNSGETLKILLSSLNEVTDFVSQIVTASLEQGLGVEQVHSAVLEMEKVTQSNSAQASNLISTATVLSSRALQLLAMLDRFSLDTQNEPQPL